MSFHLLRLILYSFLFAWSVALMGLTAYRIHYTKRKSVPDILTDRTHFYNPIVAELLTVAILGTLWSLFMIPALIRKVGRGPLGTYLFELCSLAILFIMSLIGAAIVTRQFSNLRYCRSLSKVCRIMEAIKALSWIFWGWTVILTSLAIANMMRNRHSLTGPLHGRRDTMSSYPPTQTGMVQERAAPSGVPVQMTTTNTTVERTTAEVPVHVIA